LTLTIHAFRVIIMIIFRRGEKAFLNLGHGLLNCKSPVINSLHTLDARIRITIIHADDSWVWPDHTFAARMQEAIPSHEMRVYVIKDSGHHIFHGSFVELTTRTMLILCRAQR
jgi:pimeloyl-ACP methyl ester carboxylesterase